MSAADLLREALDDAPTMRADKDGFGELAVWDANDDWVLGNYSKEGQAAIRLLSLLLAAAPHLAGMLNATERDDLTDEQVMVATLDALDKLREAVTEAGAR